MALCDRFFGSDQHFDGLLISSPQGHSGKTLVTIGLCDGFRRRGLHVQPFKKGPDYIDPSWLSVAARRACRNLDLFLIPEERLLHSFERAMEGADLAIVEGAMGLFDGVDSPETGTSAEIARLLQIPVILVVNTTRMTSSIAAMVKGYQDFQEDVRIAGVILNQVSGKRHEQKLRAAVETYCRIPVVGSIPRDLDLKIHERHLGLIPSRELKESESMVERMGRKLEEYLDLDAILSVARRGTPHPHPFSRRRCRESLHGSTSSPRAGDGTLEIDYSAVHPECVEGRTANDDTVFKDNGEKKGAAKVKIGVMYDQVFHFYYPENLEALKSQGAELVLINSLEDPLPEIDGLYIGGGFPELFLEALEKNRTLRREIKEAVEAGLPVYAECAGLMYLCESVEEEGRSYEMAGILPARVKMSKRPQGHGYVVAEVVKENSFFPQGLKTRGHEFHHSGLSPQGHLEFAYRIERGHGIQGASDGIIYKNLFASYVHLHALGTPEWAPGFVSLASREKRVTDKRVRIERYGTNHENIQP